MGRRGRAPCCDKVGLNKGSWSLEEDMRLIAYIKKHGHGNWRALPKLAGLPPPHTVCHGFSSCCLRRCGKSCRLRWINYLRPDIKRGNFTTEEEDAIIELHKLLGNKTDNEIKNMWNTHLKKRLASRERKPMATQKPEESQSSSSSSTYRSCSDHGESKSDEEGREDPSLYFTDLSVEMIDVPIGPDMDVWGVAEYDTHQEEAALKLPYAAAVPDSVIVPEFLSMMMEGCGDYSSLIVSTGEEAMEEGEEDAKGEGKKSSEWVGYLEKELGLCGAGEETDSINRERLVRDDAAEHQMETEEEDPVSSYFHKDLVSTCPSFGSC
ncbi:hypothetical protein BHE74_00043051 [Ensete ventricosum]|nr:hypothetical protein BHE74_00043051 [Ensete ventricosum]